MLHSSRKLFKPSRQFIWQFPFRLLIQVIRNESPWLSKLGRCVFTWLFLVFQTNFSCGNFGFWGVCVDVSVRDSAGEKSRGCRQENGYYSLEKNSWCKTKKIKWSYGNKFLGQRYPNMQLLPLFTSSSFCILARLLNHTQVSTKISVSWRPHLGPQGKIWKSGCLQIDSKIFFFT